MRPIRLFLILFVFITRVHAIDYYVSTTGDDSNSGTSVSSAFATIQHAVNSMSAGDTCYILGGTYHEEVDLSGIAGSAGNPITITNYQGEEVILDGRVEVLSNWTLETSTSVSLPAGNDTPSTNIPGIGNVYVTTLDNSIGDITQLFVDNESMTLARFPNALAYSDGVFFRGETQTLKSSAVHGEGTDLATPFSLAATGVSVQGCIGVFGSVRLITSHSAGSTDFSHNNPVRLESGSNYYFIEGGQDNAERVLLDSEQEWAYDESTRKLTLWPKNDVDPNGLNVFVRNQMDAFTGNANTKNIVIDGIDFFATKFDFNSSDNITIQNCDFTYYSISERALGAENNSKTADFTGSSTDFCDNIIVYNCSFKYADGTGFNANYINGITFENNLIYKVGYYTCQEWDEYGARRNTHAFHARNSKDIHYRRNTVNTTGTNQSVAFSRYGTSSPEHPIVAEYNFNTKCCGLNTDVSSMYIPEEDVHESVARYNWFIDNNRRDFRWDGANIDEVKTAKGNFYRNVGVQGTNPNKHAYKLKGDFHEIYNSIAIGDSWAFDIAEGKGGNANTVSRNNAADLWTTILSDDGTDWDLPGDDDKNYRPGSNGFTKSMHDVLRDIDNRDFRPRADAVELIDRGVPVTCTIDGVQVDVTAGYLGSAPDIGAYEYGDPVYWIGGRQEAHASMPIPKDGGINVPIDADLMYLIGLDGNSARTYLGTSANSLSLVTELSDPNNVVSLTGNFALEEATTYYWRVDTNVNGTWITGDVWSFSTIGSNSEEGSVMHILKRNATGFALDGGSLGDNSQNLYLWNANEDKEDQQWIEVDRGDGYYSYQKQATNQCIDGGESGANSQNVYLSLCDEDNQNQHWQKVDVGDGAFKLIKRNAIGFAINGGGGGVNGQNVNLFKSSVISQNLHWVITPIAGVSPITLSDITKETNKLIVYPNPVSSTVTIQGASNSTIHIYDINGRLVYTKAITSKSEIIDVSALSNGLYYAQIKELESISVIKIIKK